MPDFPLLLNYSQRLTITQTRFLFRPEARRQVPSFQIPAARANLLVPFYFRSAAPARPFFLLSFQPFLEAIFLDVFQIWFHGRILFMPNSLLSGPAWGSTRILYILASGSLKKEKT